MATVTARVDENVKKEAETLFKKMGLNMSTAMNLFLKKCILEQGIPFELKVPNKETLKAIQETEDILSGKIERKGYNSAEEFTTFQRSLASYKASVASFISRIERKHPANPGEIKQPWMTESTEGMPNNVLREYGNLVDDYNSIMGKSN